MEITDELIISYINSKKTIREKQTPKEYVQYIINRFPDTNNFKEALYRFRNNLYVRPVCKMCGNPVKFRAGYYSNYCSRSCMAKAAAITLKKNPNFKYPFEIEAIRNKAQENIKEKYGVDNVFKLKETHIKSKETKLLRYGDENYNNTEKFKETCRDRYGCDVPAQNKEIRAKQVKTSFEKYGGYFNKEKVSETIKALYGKEWYTLTDDLKSKTNTEESKQKQYNTKKKNKSFNSSKQELECFNLLKDKFTNVICQYYNKDKYPFQCDFYIPELDLYIEYNGSWTHGSHPFNSSDDEDIKKLEKWIERSASSKFYKNAINTWTVRDVNKRNIAKKNNLNYIEFWNLNDVHEFLMKF